LGDGPVSSPDICSGAMPRKHCPFETYQQSHHNKEVFMSTCDTHSNTCSTPSKDSSANCSGEQKAECCPITEKVINPVCFTEHAVKKLAKAFPHAMHGAMVDILKEKIKKSWGPMMDKEADAFLKVMDAQWDAAIKSSMASYELRQDLKKILSEECK
jgi:hypothetical protein